MLDLRRLVCESHDEFPSSDQFVMRFHKGIHGVFFRAVLNESEPSRLALVRARFVEEEVELRDLAIFRECLKEGISCRCVSLTSEMANRRVSLTRRL